MFCTPKDGACLWESQCSNFQIKIRAIIGNQSRNSDNEKKNFSTQLGREYLSVSKYDLNIDGMKAKLSTLFGEGDISHAFFGLFVS